MATDTKKPIKELYDEGMAEVFKIVGSLDATPAQRRSAKQTAKDLSSMLVSQTLQSIEGRTALLSSLIVELNGVIDSIQTTPRLKRVFDSLTAVVTKAEKLFNAEKKQLV
jgi:hypothetical protein